MNYEKGLEKLEPYIPVEEKEDDRIDFDSLRNRLLQNMKEERRYGTTETLRNDRTRIIDGLNSLARRLTQMSFTDLSLGKTPPVMPPRSSSGAVAPSSSSSQPSQSEDTFLYDAFISYSSKDKEWVRNILLPRLEQERLRICIDYRNFEIGVTILENIENAVKQSRRTLLVMTPNWVESEWGRFEQFLLQTQDPANTQRRILPLMVQHCEVPERLQMFMYLDLTDTGEFEFQMQRLLKSIQVTPPAIRSGETSPSFSDTETHCKSSAGEWNSHAIRQLLEAAFSDEEFSTFCYDFFMPVYQEFSVGLSKPQKIHRLVAYCDRQGLMKQLLGLVRKFNRFQYEKFESSLVSQESSV